LNKKFGIRGSRRRKEFSDWIGEEHVQSQMPLIMNIRVKTYYLDNQIMGKDETFLIFWGQQHPRGDLEGEDIIVDETTIIGDGIFGKVNSVAILCSLTKEVIRVMQTYIVTAILSDEESIGGSIKMAFKLPSHVAYLTKNFLIASYWLLFLDYSIRITL
jgi:hypothetical protein